jgi:hypothetical protein
LQAIVAAGQWIGPIGPTRPIGLIRPIGPILSYWSYPRPCLRSLLNPAPCTLFTATSGNVPPGSFVLETKAKTAIIVDAYTRIGCGGQEDRGVFVRSHAIDRPGTETVSPCLPRRGYRGVEAHRAGTRGREIVVRPSQEPERHYRNTGAERHGLADRIRESVAIPVTLWDERFSTNEAHRVFDMAEVRHKKRKPYLDIMASQIILQGYLDARSAR